jgi:hypothetical protein
MASDIVQRSAHHIPGSFGSRYSFSKNKPNHREPSPPSPPATRGEMEDEHSDSTPLNPPSAPSPSQDAGLIPDITQAALSTLNMRSPILDNGLSDLDNMEPVVAMKMLARGVQGLARITGEVCPTPPIMIPSTKTRPEDNTRETTRHHKRTLSRPGTPIPVSDIRKAGFEYVGPPEAQPGEFSAGDDINEPEPLQTLTIARKFFCKIPPPVSLEAYLTRMHKFCPMSPAVYLAAGVYIQKLCIEDKVVPATSRTVHRLLLASLRVAMKALEDLRYSQERFALVGGVTQEELRNLEVSLCYLMDFKLQVTQDKLRAKMGGLLDAAKLSSGLAKEPMMLHLPALGPRQLPT